VITFPFWCPACKKVADAKADPVGLLFGGAPDLKLKCAECNAVFRVALDRHYEVTVKDRLPDEPSGE
jgi:hypothetical protein